MLAQATSLVRRAAARYVRPLLCSCLDTLDTLRGRRQELTPPRRLNLVIGGGDFKAIGESIVRILKDDGLRPHDRVLDVGCGVGRMAVPLTGYLSGEGSYEGFDVLFPGVQWCSKNITGRFPNFHFRTVDVCNQTYNSRGAEKPEAFAFPYRDGEFDFAFVISVFTHMLPPSVARYLAELARVIKPDGRCVISFFLLNEESTRLLREGSSSLRFRHRVDGCLTVSLARPEDAVAYEEALVRSLVEENGFEVIEPIRYGSWCGRAAFVHFQDFVTARRR